MSHRDDDQAVQALRDECALGGVPMAGDEDVASVFGALRDTRDLSPAPMPSAALTMLLERGFGPPVTPRSTRLRVAVAQRLAAAGVTLKVLIGAGVVGAGVATAGVVGSVPGEAIVSDIVDAITSGGGSGDGDGGGVPVRARDIGPGSVPVLPFQTAEFSSPAGGPTDGVVPDTADVDGPPVVPPGQSTDVLPGQVDKIPPITGKPATPPGQVDKTPPAHGKPEIPPGQVDKTPPAHGRPETPPGQVDNPGHGPATTRFGASPGV